jgi:hypothetical protein
MKSTLLKIYAVALAAVLAAHPLSDLIASMAPGEWAELTGMQNFSGSLFEDGCSCGILADSEDAVWNPATQTLRILGAGAGFSSGKVCGKFVVYRANTNTWEVLSKPSAFRGTHSYDHHAIDIQNQVMYHRPYADRTVFRYNLRTGSWSSLPDITSSLMGYNNCCVGIAYFPEIKSLMYASVESGEMGSLIRFDVPANQWKRVGPGRNLPMGSHNHFAEYNPVHKVVIFGGPHSDRLYKVDTSLAITPIADGPFSLGNRSAVVTVDPASGQYLALKNVGNFYAYDVPSDTWHKIPGTVPVLFTFGYNDPIDIFGTVATPLWDLGAVIFVKQRTSTAKVMVYKHAPMGTGLAAAPVRSLDAVRISPNPFRSSTVIRNIGAGVERAAIYDINGKLVEDLTPAVRRSLNGTVAWNAGKFPCGLYLFRIRTSGRVVTKALLLSK